MTGQFNNNNNNTSSNDKSNNVNIPSKSNYGRRSINEGTKAVKQPSYAKPPRNE